MSGEDYIKLPNGEKIYLKDLYGKVSRDNFPENKRISVLYSVFNTNYDRKLNSNEIKPIFDSLKDFASKDGNNELSMAELMGFIKEHVKDEYYASLITPKEVMKFLGIVQKKSDESLAGGEKVLVTNTFNDVFPELSYLDIGNDNNIDASKLTFDAISKHYPSDKYEIKEETSVQYIMPHEPDSSGITWSDHEFPGSIPRTIITKQIINKETGHVVVTFRDNSNEIQINDEATGKTFIIDSWDNEDISLTIEEKGTERSFFVQNGKTSYVKYEGKFIQFDDEGYLYYKFEGDEGISYDKGIEIGRDKYYETKIQEEKPHEDISEKFDAIINSGNVEELSKLIDNSIASNQIGFDMDDYYKRTGVELTDAIQKSNLPKDIKEKLLNSICEPYVDSKFYDAHKKIEHSKVENEYYVSTDEYSIEYNGPIINVYNKTTGKRSRINLKTLLRDLDYRRKKWIGKSLRTIQSFSGEVLENLSIEIKKIETFTKEDAAASFNGNGGAGALYTGDDKISAPRLRTIMIIHELGHAIDNTANGDYLSAKGKFKKVFDECIKRYEASGHKRFDEYHPMRSIPILPINNGINYATYNEQEAFATCMEALMGQKGGTVKFLKKVMPELIDAARELYLEIRNKQQEERRKIED